MVMMMMTMMILMKMMMMMMIMMMMMMMMNKSIHIILKRSRRVPICEFDSPSYYPCQTSHPPVAGVSITNQRHCFPAAGSLPSQRENLGYK